MRNIKLTLQYDGSNYSGWQVQKKDKTVQSVLEKAILTVTGERIRVMGAGRTDAGVHAFNQVAAFRTGSGLEPAVLSRAINANLPADVRVIKASECHDDFHPRFSTKNKTYSYIISQAGNQAASHKGSVFLRRYSWQIPYEPDLALMRKAAKLLVGRHDFACFRASGCSSKHAVRTIKKIIISRTFTCGFTAFRLDVPLVKITIQADAFLRYMVRNIVGTLVDVGNGKTSPDKMKAILDSKDRRQSGPTAPPQGLFLEKIVY